uniref:BAR/IMD domain-containing adapter protein 2 n=1 Tax=Tetraodon nigroviridis TaxID=99883 RepID=H3CRM0_TETNG
KMSRTEEVNKMTENVYKGILDQFNPSLKNFVAMGKHYEKALTGVTVAAKGYFDALVKLGELASDSQGSKELGDTLFQMAEVHRQIQVQLEDVLKLFHSELLAQLEQKLELDIKYLTATLKKYQSERRSKSESIERCQSQLKKLRRKSQGSRHPNKYGDREMQFVELMSRRQGELDALVATGYKSALTEERRRYCFLVDRQCCVTKLLINHHSKVRELLSQKLSSWQHSCSQPTKLPERALNLLRHTAPQTSGAAGIAEVLRHTKIGSAQPEQGTTVPIPHSAPHSPPLPHSAPLSRAMTPVQLLHQQVGPGGSHTLSASHNPWFLKTTEMSATATLPLPRRPVSEMRVGGLSLSLSFPPFRFPPSELLLSSAGSSLPRMLPLSGPTHVEAVFAHTPGASPGGGACLLHFLPGDDITLLISEPRDGWHYGQNERTGRKGWFPFSYTQPQHSRLDQLENSLLLSKANSTSTGQLDKLMMPALSGLTPESEEERSLPPQRVSTFRPRPYSMADSNKFTFSQEGTGAANAFRINPFAHIRLRKTVTNDRSAPIIE